MPVESTASAALRRPLVTIEDAAERLATSVEVIRFLVANRRLAAVRIGSAFRFRPEDVESAVERRSDLIGGLTTDLVRDRRLSAFERASLDISDIAAFFKVSEAEVRSLLGAVSWDPEIPKTTLWALIVAGCEAESGALAAIEERVIAARKRRYVAIPSPIRALVQGRDGSRCRYCGRMVRGDRLFLDHVVPHSRGGAHDPSNLVVTCKPCNSYKSNRLPHEAGMTLLAPGEQRRGRRPGKRPTLPPPDRAYAILVMGD